MHKQRYTAKFTLIAVFAVSLGMAQAQEPKIKNLAEHVAKEAGFKKKSALEKLKVVAELAQKRRLDYSDKTQAPLIGELVHAYMTEKGKDDPGARLKAFAELKGMNDWGKPLAQLNIDDKSCSIDFVRYLSANKAYQSGGPEAKMEILADLIKKKMWSSQFGQGEGEMIGYAYIAEKTTGLSGKEKALESLKLLASLKDNGVLPWGNTYSGMERLYFYEYINAYPAYQKMSPDEKTAHLKDLESKKLIMSFLQSDMESVIVAKKLIGDKSFMAKDAKAKGEFIDDLGKQGKIHTFSKSKIRQLLGLPRR